MPFELGHSGGPGRPKGSSNQISGQVKEAIADFLLSRFESLDELYNSLDRPRDRAKMLIELLPYLVPKQKAVEVSGNIYQKMSEEELMERFRKLTILE